MKTTVYKAKDLDRQEVKNHIHQVVKHDGLVVFPTETVYGIGASALSQEASAKIYQVKGRPSDNPLIVHIGKLEDLYTLTEDIAPIAEVLIKKFWPGPLTLVFKKRSHVPDAITGNLETVAVRMPSSDVALNVLSAAATPMCAPSANISGRPSSTLFKHVLEDLEGRVEIMIDGGQSLIGIESTVLDLSTSMPTLLRPGAVTKAMIEDAIGQNILDASLDEATDVPKSPGMKYTHYAPKGTITVVYGEKEKVQHFINDALISLREEKTAVLCHHDYVSSFKGALVFDLGKTEEEVAANLFIALRSMDEEGITHIFTHAFESDALGQAIMNRLLKASGYNKIFV